MSHTSSPIAPLFAAFTPVDPVNLTIPFISHSGGATFLFTQRGPVMGFLVASELPAKRQSSSADVAEKKPAAALQGFVQNRFINSNPNVTIVAGTKLPGLVNYLKGGDRSQWHTGVSTYDGVTYQGLYPGVDLLYNGSEGNLKGTYTVAPGADPDLIRWRYQGVKNIEVGSTGDLQISLDVVDPKAAKGSASKVVNFTEHTPIAWQVIGSKQQQVAVNYAVAANGSIGFKVGAYDPGYPLIIDPTITYSTFLGGSNYDGGNDIALDSSGNAVVVGYTYSTNFPTSSGAYDTALYAWNDVFVTKLNITGTAILFSTFIGGNDYDIANAVDLDSDGNVYIAGDTGSSDYPVSSGTLQQYKHTAFSGWSGFVSRLSASGTSLDYSTYLSCTIDCGLAVAHANDIAVDASRGAYVTGWTNSEYFHTLNAYQSTKPTNAGSSAFVTKFQFTQGGSASLAYSTYLAGNARPNGPDAAYNEGWDIDVDDAGQAYVVGWTNAGDFPRQNASQYTMAGREDAFITKMSATGSSLVYSTYLGGTRDEHALSVAVQKSEAYVTGFTSSTDFPLRNAFQTTKASYDPTFVDMSDVFVTKFDQAGSRVYSTYLGGGGGNYSVPQQGNDIKVDPFGNAYVGGVTRSNGFPTRKAFQPFRNGGYNDGFITMFDATGTAIYWSSFLGGQTDGGTGDSVEGVVLNASNEVYVTGSTGFADFPTTTGAVQTTNAGGLDAFATKISGPPGNAGPADNELGSQCEVCVAPDTEQPVNTASGNFWHSFGDLIVPGRGPQLGIGRTYRADTAAQLGPVGYGWTHSYNMAVITDTASSSYFVRQGNGSIAPFPITGTQYSRVLAGLVRNGDGTFVFTHDIGQTKYYFKADGRLDRIADRLNYTTTLGYDGSQRLATVTDPASRSITFTYWLTTGFTSLVKTVTDPAGRTVQYEYNSNKELNLATDVAGNQYKFGYGSGHRMVTMKDPQGGTISNTYEAVSPYRVTHQVDALSRSLDFGYSSCGTYCKQTVITDSVGLPTTFIYDQNRLVRMTRGSDPATQSTYLYVYDPDYTTGVSAMQDPLGRVITSTYDLNGNVVATKDNIGRLTSYAYNGTNDLLVITNTLGLTTSFSYAANGTLLSVTEPLTETGQLITSSFGYDPLKPGDVLTVTNALGKKWLQSYNSYGYPTTSTNPLGETSRAGYDLVGRALSVTSARNYTSTAAYNAYGQPLVLTDTLGYTSTFSYDANGNLLSAKDAKGQTTTYGYNANNEPLRVTRPDSTHSDYGYDGGGRVITQSNGLGETIRYSYDSYSRLIAVTDPLTHSVSYAYDIVDRPVVITDENGSTITLSYDAVDRLVNINYSDSGTPDVSFAYNQLGARTAMTDGTGTSLYSYDSLQRLVSVKQGAGQVVGYGYDLVGRMTTLTYPGSKAVTHSYNDANRLTSVTDWLTHTTSFGYNADGSLTSRVYPNGTSTALTFDAAGQLTSLIDQSGATPFLSLNYSRDPLGLLSLANEGTAGSHAYGYDSLGRLTGDGLNAGSAISSTWSYDPATRISQTTITPGQPISWTNLISVTASGNTITKTGSSYSWNAGATSSQSVAAGDVSVQVTADRADVYTQFGLGRNNTTSSGDDIDYSIRLAAGTVQVFELSTLRGSFGSYVAGDLLKVALVDGVVRYYRNNVLLYSSTVAPTYPLRFDSSIADPGARIIDAQLFVGTGNLSWSNTVNVTVNGNTISKSGGVAYQWDAGATSAQASGAGDVSAQLTADSASTDVIFGLSDSNTTASYTDIDFGIYLASGTIKVSESGTWSASYGSYVAGDVFKVAVVGGAVKYYKNSTVFYTSLAAPTYPLRFDSSIADPGARILRAYFYAGASPVMNWTGVTNVAADGNTIKKTGGVQYAWDAGAVSSQTVAAGDVYAEATADSTSYDMIFGLSDNNTTASYTDIDFGIYLAGGTIKVSESGSWSASYGSYVAGDIFRVAVVGGKVRYYKNGTLFYTSLLTTTYPLRFDSSLADLNGRIIGAQLGWSLSTPSSSTRSYNNADQLLSLVDKLGAHNKRNLSFTYSLTGNRTQQVDSAMGTTINYGYDQDDRLISYNSGAATYGYDGNGLRMSKTRSGSTEQFVWDIGAGLPMLLQDGNGSYIYGPGGMLLEQVRSDNTVYYYHQDQLGSVRALSNSSGAVVSTYSYDAYGQVITKTGSITNPFGFAGEYTDAESGLIYLRARYYDPQTQQFITRDPIYTITEEPYGYVSGSPLNKIDPAGLQSGNPNDKGRGGIGSAAWEMRLRAMAVRTGRFDQQSVFDPTFIWSQKEWEVAKYLMQEEQVIMRPVARPTGGARGPDAKVMNLETLEETGVCIEFKTLGAGGSSTAAKRLIEKSVSGPGQSDFITINASESAAMTADEVFTLYERLIRQDFWHGKLKTLRVYNTKYGYDITFTLMGPGSASTSGW